MAGYIKVWTTIKSNEAFLSLPLIKRGAWYEILVDAKLQRDDGTVFYRNRAAMGHSWGCEGKTGGKILAHLQDISLLTYTINGQGVVSIQIPNYKHWQELDVKTLVENTRKKSGKFPPLRPDQTRPDQSKPDHKEIHTGEIEKIDAYKDFMKYVSENRTSIFNNVLEKIHYREIGKPQELWDKVVLGTMVTWIRENREQALSALNQRFKRNWISYIDWWVKEDWQKRRSEIDKTRGMSAKQEAEYFRKKEMNRGSGGTESLGEIINRVKESNENI